MYNNSCHSFFTIYFINRTLFSTDYYENLIIPHRRSNITLIFDGLLSAIMPDTFENNSDPITEIHIDLFVNELPPLTCDTVNNVTSGAYLQSIYYAVAPLFIALLSISTLWDLIILFTVFCIRKKHLTPTLIFTLSLCGADAVAATAIIISSVMSFQFHITHAQCIVMVVEVFRLGSMVSSVLHFVALAVNHWMGITKPLHYVARMTRRTAYQTVIVMWIFPILMFFVYFSLIPGQGFQSAQCKNFAFTGYHSFRTFVTLMFFAPLSLMLVVYFHVVLVIGRRSKNFSKLEGVVGKRGSIREKENQLRQNTKALITTLIILFVHLIGWSPALISYALICKDCLVSYRISLCVSLPVSSVFW